MSVTRERKQRATPVRLTDTLLYLTFSSSHDLFILRFHRLTISSFHHLVSPSCHLHHLAIYTIGGIFCHCTPPPPAPSVLVPTPALHPLYTHTCSTPTPALHPLYTMSLPLPTSERRCERCGKLLDMRTAVKGMLGYGIAWFCSRRCMRDHMDAI